MAKFPKGRTFKDNRLYVAAAFPQTGKNPQGQPMTGYNVSLGIAADLDGADHEHVVTDPMLQYNKYKDAKGNEKTSYAAAYSKEQYEAIQAIANTEGDAPVFRGDLFVNKQGKLTLNTKTLAADDKPFDHAKHTEVIAAVREERKVEREAKVAAAAQTTEQETEQEQDLIA